MKEDLGSTDEARQSNRGHLVDIEVFEKEVRAKLRSKLLTPSQCDELSTLQFPTLSQLRSLVNDPRAVLQRQPTQSSNSPSAALAMEQ